MALLKRHKSLKRTKWSWVVVAHAFDPSIQATEAGGSLWVQSQTWSTEFQGSQGPHRGRNKQTKSNREDKTGVLKLKEKIQNSPQEMNESMLNTGPTGYIPAAKCSFFQAGSKTPCLRFFLTSPGRSWQAPSSVRISIPSSYPPLFLHSLPDPFHSHCPLEKMSPQEAKLNEWI